MKKPPQKILAGIGIASLLGAAGLGFLIYKNNAALNEARTAFTTTAQSYKGLRTQPLYPSSENLKKLEEQRDAAAEAAETALKELVPIAFALEPISPEQFQEKLRQSVNAVTAKAAERQVELPDNFYLGFENYRTQAPVPGAAPALWRQLRAVELVVNTLLDSRVDAISSLNRVALPEESGKASSTALVARYPFTVNFRGIQSAFRRSLNEITTSKEQFFIPRNVVIHTEGEKQIPKATSLAPAVTPAATGGQVTEEVAAAQPERTEERGALQYIVGLEKLDITLNLEMVVFAESFSK